MSNEELKGIMVVMIFAIVYGIGYVVGYMKGKDAGSYQELARKVEAEGLTKIREEYDA